MEWIKFSEQHPDDNQFCLVWDKYYGNPRILCWNEHYNCWDDEEGDDIEFSVEKNPNRVVYWMALPENPED